MTARLTERHFEDYQVGEVFEFGDELVTEQEIRDFASRYDPQPFHVDAAAASRSIYGGLIASGWMTAGIMMRMLVEHFVPRDAGMGSPGVDELRWLRPVRPGDRLRTRVTILQTRRSKSKPDRGMVLALDEVLNQDGDLVMTLKAWGMYRARTAPD
ncbi:MAG: MaoC family dehydratase [Quisquiliibacterium sp.]